MERHTPPSRWAGFRRRRDGSGHRRRRGRTPSRLPCSACLSTRHAVPSSTESSELLDVDVQDFGRSPLIPIGRLRWPEVPGSRQPSCPKPPRHAGRAHPRAFRHDPPSQPFLSERNDQGPDRLRPRPGLGVRPTPAVLQSLSAFDPKAPKPLVGSPLGQPGCFSGGSDGPALFPHSTDKKDSTLGTTSSTRMGEHRSVLGGSLLLFKTTFPGQAGFFPT